MEDENKEIEEGTLNEEETSEEEQEPTPTPEENPEETQPEESEGETEDKPKEEDDDHKKNLEKLEGKGKSELEKAERALYFTAQRLKELGGDPKNILGDKPKKEDSPDTLIEKKFAERDARAMTKSESEYNLVMWYVNNKNLSVEDAYVVANKGKLQREIIEAKRGKVDYAPESNNEQAPKRVVPKRNPEEVSLLSNRGLHYNPKTQTYQGKFTEEYYDHDSKSWKSRKLPRK